MNGSCILFDQSCASPALTLDDKYCEEGGSDAVQVLIVGMVILISTKVGGELIITEK